MDLNPIWYTREPVGLVWFVSVESSRDNLSIQHFNVVWDDAQTGYRGQQTFDKGASKALLDDLTRLCLLF